jgi:hypothetical protein
MAQRRMFSKSITESDDFLSMGTDVQNLYFHLGMQADDDGFVSPKRVMRMIGAADDSLTHLVAKGFIIPFEDRVVVITDWKENNYLRNDRHKPTIYQKEMAQLSSTNGRYTIGIPNDNHWLTQDRIGKDRKKDFAEAKSSLPILVVSDEKKEPRRLPDKKALNLREWCYKRIKEEYGVPPTPSVADYIQLQKALKSLDDKDIKYMMDDALDAGKGQTVRSVFTDRQIDIYRQQNI